jgi:WD40 repeat protein
VLIAPDGVVGGLPFAALPGKNLELSCWKKRPSATSPCETGKEIMALKEEGDNLRAVFSPDGQRILTVNGKTGRLWETGTGRQICKLDGEINSLSEHGRYIAFLRNPEPFSPDGRYVAAARGGDNVGIWDGTGGRLLTTLRGHLGGGQVALTVVGPLRPTTEDHSADRPSEWRNLAGCKLW